MTTRYFGAAIPRNEDRRLLTGEALFVDDVELPGMLHAALCAVRSRTDASGASTHRRRGNAPV
jgi:CO/xanthine dehydrogenase Mo-binding subunit